jgi:hypothetical protein
MSTGARPRVQLIDKPSRHTMPDGFFISTRVGDFMSEQTPQDHISKKQVVYAVPGVDRVTVRRDQPYRVTDAGPLTMDVYYPPDATSGAPMPAVVFVTGFSDAGARKMLGCTFKEMGSYVSWARLTAASGLVGITYENREPATDAHAVLAHVREHAASLNVDDNRIGVWSCSGNGPNALSFVIQNADAIRCAALLYPYTIDRNGTAHVASAATQFRFVTPLAGRSIDELPRNVPLFIVRAGQDVMPGLNAALDQFVSGALANNLPVTVINHATGPHAFDLFDDTELSRHIIRSTLTFLRFQLVELRKTL